MPKIFEIAYGLSVYIYFKDHNPPHVHVYYGSAKNHEASAVLEIGSWDILEVSGFSEKDVRLLVKELKKREQTLMEKWDEYKD